MGLDASGWSGEGEFTERLVAVLSAMPEVRFLKVEDAPASRADAGFSFISNEVFVGFATVRRVAWGRILGLIPHRRSRQAAVLTLAGLEGTLTAHPDIGAPDYADDGMLQYLRTQRIIPPYQTRGYKLVELVRVYEAGTIPRQGD
jgi:hypothetical protein